MPYLFTVPLLHKNSMPSMTIISDKLHKWAENVDAPERGLIHSWNDASHKVFSEDIIVIDTMLSATEDKAGEDTVIEYEPANLMRFFRSNLPDLLESEKVVFALIDEVQQYHETANRTVAVHNMEWLRNIGQISRIEGPPDREGCFIRPTPDPLNPSEVHLLQRRRPYSSYFINVSHTNIEIAYENANLNDYEIIADIKGSPEGVVAGIAIESWEDAEGNSHTPSGTLVLLPRPETLRVDAKEWFRSLIEIGNEFLPDSEGLDEFNRVIGRTTTPALKNIYNICDSLPRVANQLTNRYADRPTLEISDEYDVQDLFHALLHLFFDDIREEE